jgi:tetratricopeptide (TPR) repeat protein
MGMSGFSSHGGSKNQAAMEAFDAAAQSLLDLARAEYGLGRIDSAAQLLARAADAARDLGQQDPRLARALNRLGVIRSRQGNHSEAEHLLREAVAIVERTNMSGMEVVTFLTNLGCVYRATSKLAKARATLERAMEVAANSQGEPDLAVAWTLDQIGDLEACEGSILAAVFSYRRALAIQEHESGSDEWNIVATLNKLAAVYLKQDRYNEAEPLLVRVVQIHERALGWNDPAVAKPLLRLAELYAKQRKDAQAEQLAGYALKLFASTLPAGHPEIVGCLEVLSGIYRGLGRYADSEAISETAQVLASGVGRHEQIARFTLPDPPKMPPPRGPAFQTGAAG